MLAGTLSGVEMGLDLAGVPHARGGVGVALAYLAGRSGAHRRRPRYRRRSGMTRRQPPVRPVRLSPASPGPPRRTRVRHRSGLRPGDPALAARLRREIEGEVRFDPADRGRYSTDASIYQIEPIGVVAPRNAEDVARTIAICREAAPRSCRAGPAPRSAGRPWARRWSSTPAGISMGCSASTKVRAGSRCSPASCSTASTPGSHRRGSSSPWTCPRPTGPRSAA